jgi:Rod binding domain-containing protein
MILKMTSTTLAPPPAPAVPDKKMLAVAREFEAFFIAQILKSAVPASEDTSLLSNGNVRQFEAIRDQFLAGEMSRSGGFSLAADLARQLARRP